MYSLSTFCCVCLHDGEQLQSLEDSDFDNVQLLTKLKYCALQTDECVLDDAEIFICIQCCHILRLAYNFKRMCIKNSKFIRGYVSQLNNDEEEETNISLQKLKDYVDNIPLVEHLTQEKQIQIKQEKFHETERDELKHFEPEINIQESDVKIDIDEIPITNKNKQKRDLQINNNNKDEIHPLTENNDFQEKSSTQTLDLLKNLVHGTKSAAVEKLRELITKPIPDESNDEFQFNDKDKDKEKEKENETTSNDFETVYVMPTPSEELKLEPEDAESEEAALLPPGSDEIQNLLNRDDNYCPICRKTFLCKSYYERHITMHTGIKNYECDVCHKRFTRKSTLKTHFLVHTGDASFTCPLCHKIFTQKGNMKSHMHTHFSVKNYRCFECGKSFSYKSALKTHLALHEKGKRQQCPVCRKLIEKNHFVAHLNVHKNIQIAM